MGSKQVRNSQTNAPTTIAPASVIDRRSIAVLPFANMSADKADEYLGEGISEEIIGALSRIKGLKVPARTSCFAFKGKNEDILKIGEQLRVGTVLEGSISKVGNKLRVTAQLISIADGFHIWSETYDRSLDDLLAIRTDVAARVAQALKGQLLGEENQQLAKRATLNPEAHRLYLQGRYLWNRRNTEAMKQALDHFNQAIAQDASYALAYAGAADCYLLLPGYTHLPPRDTIPKARAAALKALELDDSLAEPHVTLAAIKHGFDWEWLEAEAEFRRAIQLNPNYATAHHWFADNLRSLGRLGAALVEIKRAQELDPLSPIINAAFGEMLCLDGKEDWGIAALQKQIALDPSFVPAHNILGSAYVRKGRLPEAIAELEKARQLGSSGTMALCYLALAYARTGRTNDAEAIRGQMLNWVRQGLDLNVGIGGVEHALGRDNQALEYLAKALHERGVDLISLYADPFWKDLRPHPRFQAILKRMNLVK